MSHLKKFIALLSVSSLLTNSAFAATYYVDTPGDGDADTCVPGDLVDDDNCTFRDATTMVANGDQIEFLLPYTIVNIGGAYTIPVDNVTVVPNSTVFDGDGNGLDGLIVDGNGFELDPGASFINGFNSGIIVNGDNADIDGAFLGVENDGVTANGNFLDGIQVFGDDATIQNSVLGGNAGYGIYADTVDGLTISNNKIGVDDLEDGDVGNTSGGILFSGDTAGVISVDANAIGGNGAAGIEFAGGGTLGGTYNISNNGIGTNTFGDQSDLGNDTYGIYAQTNATSVLDLTLDNNVISENVLDGVRIEDGTSFVAINNKVGTDAFVGDDDHGNGGAGFRVDAQTVQIGSDLDGINDGIEGNTIVANGGNGIFVTGNSSVDIDIHGNNIGADLQGNDNRPGGPAFGNTGDGIQVDSTVAATVDIGGVSPGVAEEGRNIIIDNGGGISINGVDNAATVNIQNNLIGMESNQFGAADAFGNNTGGGFGDGIFIDLTGGSIANLLIGTDGDGSDDADEGNVIVDNNNGVYLGNEIVSAVIAGNVFGLVDDGGGFDTAAGNANSAIFIDDFVHNLLTLVIGGDLAVEGNQIAGSGDYGVRVNSSNNVDVTLENNIFGISEDLTTAVANTLAAVRFDDGDDLVLRDNSIFNSGGSAVEVFGGVTASLYGNFIGTDGVNEHGNGGHGVHVDANTITSVTIGGNLASLANVIADSGSHGIFIEDLTLDSTPVSVFGNYVGLCANPDTGLIDGDLVGCANVGDGLRATIGALTIGGGSGFGALGDGPGLAEANVFSNNGGYGIYMLSQVTSAELYGNIVGLTRAFGDVFDTAAGNVLDGIRMDSSNAMTFIVGSAPDDARMNVVSANGGDGLHVAAFGGGNVDIINSIFGSDFTGTVDLGNAGDGVDMQEPNGTINLGDNTADGRNVLSGNTQCGLRLGAGVLNNTLNYIGLASDGVTAMANDGGDICDLTSSSSGRRTVPSSADDDEEEVVEEEVVEEGSEEVVGEDAGEESEEVVVEEEAVEEIEEMEEGSEEVVEEDAGEENEEVVVEEEVVEEEIEEVVEEVVVPVVVPVRPVVPVLPVVDAEEAIEAEVLEEVEKFAAAFDGGEKVLENELPDFDDEEVKKVFESRANSGRRYAEQEEVTTVVGVTKKISRKTRFVYEPNYDLALDLQKSADLNGEDIVYVTTFSDLDNDGVADILEVLLDEDDDHEGELMDKIFSGEVNAFGGHEACSFASEGFRITNLPKDCAVVGSELLVWVSGLEAGKQFDVVVVKDGEEYEVTDASLSGEVDENGKGVLPVNFEEEGVYYLVARSEDNEFFVIKVEVDEDLNAVVNEMELANVDLDVQEDLVKGFAKPGEMVFVTWQSVVLNSVVIADANEGYFEAQIPRNIAANEEHTVTVYSYNPERIWLSSISALVFNR